jgi:hypothetical protein
MKLYTSGYPWPSDTMKSFSFFKPRERHTKAQRSFFFIYNLLFLKSPPWNPLLADLITATLFLFKFSFSPGVRAVHHSHFQATFALWSKASNLHYSLVRLSPSPPLPSPVKHTQLFYTGLCHSLRRCRAGPGWPSVTDLTQHSSRRAPSVKIRECRTGPDRPSMTNLSSVTNKRSEFIYKIVYFSRTIIVWRTTLCTKPVCQ